MYETTPQLQFKRKLASLDKAGLKLLLEKLKAEDAPLGMIMAVAKEYGARG